MSDERDEAAASGRGSTADATSDETAAGDAAETFLALEEELSGAGPDGTVRATVVDAERVPAERVPHEYPVEVTTPEALALEFEPASSRPGTGTTGAGQRVTAYFEWQEGAPDERLGRLTALHGIEPGRFADFYGRSVLLRAVDGHYVPYVPAESPRGTLLGVYGVLAGLCVNLLCGALLAVGLGGVLASVPVLAAWLAANVVGVPVATYLDAWHLRTHTDWEQGPAFWALLGMLPVVNVLTSAAYLRSRRSARPVAGE